jgi:hypothetical protein
MAAALEAQIEAAQPLLTTCAAFPDMAPVVQPDTGTG